MGLRQRDEGCGRSRIPRPLFEAKRGPEWAFGAQPLPIHFEMKHLSRSLRLRVEHDHIEGVIHVFNIGPAEPRARRSE
jgi:hypothetical protein